MMRFLYLFAMIFLVQPALAQEPPDTQLLNQKLGSSLPHWWEIVDVKLQASHNYGTSVKPVWKQRVEVRVRQKQNTFSQSDLLGGVTIITELSPKGHETTLYGIASSTFRAGKWNTEFEIENPQTLKTGQPQSNFAGRTIIAGSNDETAWLAEIKKREQQALERRKLFEAAISKVRAAKLAEEKLRQAKEEKQLAAIAARKAQEERIRKAEASRILAETEGLKKKEALLIQKRKASQLLEAEQRVSELVASLDGADIGKQRSILITALSGDSFAVKEKVLEFLQSSDQLPLKELWFRHSVKKNGRMAVKYADYENTLKSGKGRRGHFSVNSLEIGTGNVIIKSNIAQGYADKTLFNGTLNYNSLLIDNGRCRGNLNRWDDSWFLGTLKCKNPRITKWFAVKFPQ